ncbi:hypothetical protein WOSG25_041420 [Weissella oryzae SG25]|uniref:Uncharacterized protein n=1 Tax=Weissella oryzae (strain DSM 25784 / JCM 18191 / LMG 30913 / SG25) TaxID=1329250 RepID=A0A069D048_WEIOS|nr:hypothetical protein [Weissella oryzae]GAK30701.1 hypothetical protein WOSG25_041420 [Weissella oryzae SG25]
MTSDAEKLLVLIFKNYKDKIKAGSSRSNAKKFGHYEELHAALNLNISLVDTADYIGELVKAEYLDASYGSNLPMEVKLTDKGIEFGEKKFVNDVKDVLNWAGSIVNIFKP